MRPSASACLDEPGMAPRYDRRCSRTWCAMSGLARHGWACIGSDASDEAFGLGMPGRARHGTQKRQTVPPDVVCHVWLVQAWLGVHQERRFE